jgi:hypothetical protein
MAISVTLLYDTTAKDPIGGEAKIRVKGQL